ncbi:MAG: cupredoxin domain-containing protein [Candidatus Dormibacteria bacterium]
MLAGCGGGSVQPSPKAVSALAGCTAARALSQVTVDATNHFRFVPAKVCLRVGGTVTWVNITTELDHTSTDEPSLAASAADASLPPGAHGWNLPLPSGKSAHLTFTKPGVYRYFCIPHETLGMLGVIVVVNSG